MRQTEIHEPMRLLFVIESTAAAMERARVDNARLLQPPFVSETPVGMPLIVMMVLAAGIGFLIALGVFLLMGLLPRSEPQAEA